MFENIFGGSEDEDLKNKAAAKEAEGVMMDRDDSAIPDEEIPTGNSVRFPESPDSDRGEDKPPMAA